MIYYNGNKLDDFKQNLNNNSIENQIILDKNCHSYKIKSTLKINYKSKDYFIIVSKKDCEKYIIGDKIKLLYSKKYNEFINPEYANSINNLIPYLLAIFTLLPLKLLSNLMNNRNSS